MKHFVVMTHFLKSIGLLKRGSIFIYVWYTYMFYLVYLFRCNAHTIVNGVAIKALLENNLEVIDGKVVDNIGLLN